MLVLQKPILVLEEGTSSVAKPTTEMGKKTQVMYEPAHFKGVAERVMKGYDPKHIWTWLASKEYEVCRRIIKTKNEDVVADIILENKAEFLRQNQKRFQNQQDAPSTSGKGKGKGKNGIS